MNTISAIFLIVVLVGIYLAYINPNLKIVNNLKSNKVLTHYVETVNRCESYDERSVKKFKLKLSLFLDAYSRTFDYPATSDRFIRKMIVRKSETMKYLNRIPFRLPNDRLLFDEITNANQNIELIMENYLVDASKRNKYYYFPTNNTD